MELNCQGNGFCCPFRIVDDGEEDGRLGGRPPKGIVPSREGLVYFATVKLVVEPAGWVSIFVGDIYEMLEMSDEVSGLGLVEAVVHASAERASESPYSSGLSEHGIRCLEPVEDLFEFEPGFTAPRSGHKIGGKPYLVRERDALRATLDDLQGSGFVLVAQFDFPGGEGEAVVDGGWPFGNGMFSLLGRAPFGEDDWRWYFAY